jgi:hypothetical protein
MFNYVNDNRVVPRRDAVYRTIRAELILIGNELIGPNHDLHLRWDEFMNDAYVQMASRAQTWARTLLNEMNAEFLAGHLTGTRNWTTAQISDAIAYWRNRAARWGYPSPPPPPSP